MDNLIANAPIWVAAAAAILGSIWAIVKIVVKLTPSTKDDEFVAKADPIVKRVTGSSDDSAN
jgi:hypothetical protein